MSNPLIQFILQYTPLTNRESDIISETFQTVQLKKEDSFLKEGQICKHLGFIEAGLVMYYKISESGEEIVCDFSKEKEWVSQYQSFVTKTPSGIFIRAIEPTRLQTITLDGLNHLYGQIPGFEKLSRQLVEKAFMDMIKRSVDFQNLKAEERYEKLLTDYQGLINRVPQYYLASFLGIAPPSLSRIRKNRAG